MDNLHQPITLNLFISLNAKTEVKAKRILKRIAERIGQKLFVEAVYRFDSKEFVAHVYLECEPISPEVLITKTLILLDKIGEKWIVESPNLKHQEYWKFRGERYKQMSNFKINGIESIKFELTNYQFERTLDYVL